MELISIMALVMELGVLNVHEGPQSISKTFSNVELQEGMIISNELLSFIRMVSTELN